MTDNPLEEFEKLDNTLEGVTDRHVRLVDAMPEIVVALKAAHEFAGKQGNPELSEADAWNLYADLCNNVSAAIAKLNGEG